MLNVIQGSTCSHNSNHSHVHFLVHAREKSTHSTRRCSNALRSVDGKQTCAVCVEVHINSHASWVSTPLVASWKFFCFFFNITHLPSAPYSSLVCRVSTLSFRVIMCMPRAINYSAFCSCSSNESDCAPALSHA